ncbi:MAG TPA: cation-translocating P-type ATPase C-terminal domain-containing protein [Candidatus Saccharimonadales bacterium]|nr:cation-translocating P-type ATPase C-terminal domain-containing protein [Candidatus Saccharimonadales bacterium]
MQDAGLFLGLALLAALLPTGMPVAARLIFKYTAQRLLRRSAKGGQLSIGEPQASARGAIAQALRLNLAGGAAEVLAILASIVAYAQWHLVPAMNVQQILAIDLLALSLPVAALSHDHKLGRVHGRLLNRSTLLSLGFFGAIAGALTYLNYVFFFVRHTLSAAYLDPSLPLYHQAMAVSLATLVLCLYAYLLFDRADSQTRFFAKHLWSNERLLCALGISLLLVFLAIYAPPLQWLLKTGPLSAMDWLTAIFVALLYSCFRLLQRHTRQHSHRAVVKLHREVRA